MTLMAIKDGECSADVEREGRMTGGLAEGVAEAVVESSAVVSMECMEAMMMEVIGSRSRVGEGPASSKKKNWILGFGVNLRL